MSRVAAPLAAVLIVSACGPPARPPGDLTASDTATTASRSQTVGPAPSSTPAQPDSRGTRPTAIRIPSIDIDSQVQPVLAEDRVLQIPPEPWVVGWWRDGVGAGSGSGTVVMTAHLDSRQYGQGPFSRAQDLQPGARMRLTDTGGASHDYVVEAVDTYRKAVLPYAELFTQRGPERVVLVTCGGTYRRDAGGWDSNVVVTFVPA